MTHAHDAPTADDPYHLSRFMRAQEPDYAHALSEIKGGRKRSHWMWYIFPQIDGLGVQRDVEALRDQECRGGQGVP